MPGSLVMISGGSSGIGLALAQTVPWPGARVINLSRRAADRFEHAPADLADPAQWPRIGELFERELKGFAGQRAVFVHAAGTLEPIGFAGEVDAAAYQRSVLLGSASTQVLGDAFLRAARGTRAECWLVMITSGAASHPYAGWSAYGAGKAAMDQWTRTAGLEQQQRGGHVRVLAVAPGIVATAMQDLIRSMPPSRFPEVARFVEFFEKGELREPREVAAEIWALLRRPLPNGAVVDLRDKPAEDSATVTPGKRR